MDKEFIICLVFLLSAVALFGCFCITYHNKEMAIIERGNVMVCPACHATLKLVREDL